MRAAVNGLWVLGGFGYDQHFHGCRKTRCDYIGYRATFEAIRYAAYRRLHMCEFSDPATMWLSTRRRCHISGSSAGFRSLVLPSGRLP